MHRRNKIAAELLTNRTRCQGGAPLTPLRSIYILWGAWVVSWLIASIWSAPTEKRSRGPLEVAHRLLTLVGAILLLGEFSPRRFPVGPLWSASDGTGWLLTGLVTAGFLFAWWARIHLGRLWSSGVTKKVDHRVINTGPYGIVRHPIYTGIIFSAFATAVAKGTALALFGAAVLAFGFYFKARIEERFLRTELGAEVYDAYARRVPMLIPFLV
jgi:protein-S-isoprenylcysteine O-methyltransferase Ste14